MTRITAAGLVLLMLACLCSAQEIQALETGTIVVEDKFLRLNTCISKTVALKLSKEYFDLNEDIEAIATISHLKMDDQLSFSFKHEINCQVEECQFELNLERFSAEVNPLFNYELSIDFIIGHGIRAADLNMTYFKQVFSPKDKRPFARAILIPNGFSDVSLTGNVQLTRLPSNDFILTYSDPSGQENIQNSMGWGLNRQFIFYKVVFLFHEQKVTNSVESLFAGFLSTKDKQIDSSLQVNKETSQIMQKSVTGETSCFYLPFGNNQLFDEGAFEDRRAMVQTDIPNSQEVKSSSSPLIFTLVLGVALFVIFEGAFLLYRSKTTKKQSQSDNSKAVPVLSVSFSESVQEKGEHLVTPESTIPTSVQSGASMMTSHQL